MTYDPNLLPRTGHRVRCKAKKVPLDWAAIWSLVLMAVAYGYVLWGTFS